MDRPYLLFLGDARDDLAAKSARGVLDWRPEWCLGQLRLDGCKTSLGLAEMPVEEAASAGARTMIVGIANAGGFIPDSWTATIVGARRRAEFPPQREHAGRRSPRTDLVRRKRLQCALAQLPTRFLHTA